MIDNPQTDRRERYAAPPTTHATDAEVVAEMRATNQRLNREKQRLESELATYRRAVADWEISEHGTYVPLRTLAAIAKAAGIDVHARWELHYERVERAEAELRRMADEAQQQPETETLPPVTEYRLETWNGDAWMTLVVPREPDIARRIADEYLRGYPTAEMRILRCTRTAVVIERPGAPDVSGPRAADSKLDGADRIVAYRSSGARLLRCLRHAPSDITGFTPVTSQDLPNGGTCTYPECGVDVLIPQKADRD